MARAYALSSTVTATPVIIFQSNRYAGGVAKDGEPCKAIKFIVDSASAVALMVNIPVLHGTDYFPIIAGTFEEFVALRDGSGTAGAIDIVNIKGNGGTATYSGGVKA